MLLASISTIALPRLSFVAFLVFRREKFSQCLRFEKKQQTCGHTALPLHFSPTVLICIYGRIVPRARARKRLMHLGTWVELPYVLQFSSESLNRTRLSRRLSLVSAYYRLLAKVLAEKVYLSAPVSRKSALKFKCNAQNESRRYGMERECFFESSKARGIVTFLTIIYPPLCQFYDSILKRVPFGSSRANV